MQLLLSQPIYRTWQPISIIKVILFLLPHCLHFIALFCLRRCPRRCQCRLWPHRWHRCCAPLLTTFNASFLSPPCWLLPSEATIGIASVNSAHTGENLFKIKASHTCTGHIKLLSIPVESPFARSGTANGACRACYIGKSTSVNRALIRICRINKIEQTE